MSEPLSAVEIEDVLSSIRRLVSEDMRPAAHPPADVDAPPAAKARPALILTPALRVVPELAPEPPPRVVALPIEEVVASVGAAVPSEGQGWEAETGDAEPAAEPAWAEATWQDSEPVEAEGGLGNSVPDDVPEGGAAELVDAVEEDAAAQAGRGAGFVEDAEWLAAAEAEVIAGLEQERADSFDDFALGGEMSFDEEVLRDLVRDLIREELQGHLGERITRNIRKLVRAEIARALAAAELD